MKNYYIISFRECGSTQDVAKEFIEKGLRDGTVVICEEMSEGRGRKGRKWIAEKGGLWLTLIRSPPSGRGMHLVGLAAGLAVAATIRDLFPQINPCVKWPNDVYLNGKKLAGILTEAQQIGNSLRFLFVGVGVNLNNEAPFPSSISLKDIVKEEVDTEVFLHRFLERFGKYYDLVLKGLQNELVNEVKKVSCDIGKYVKIIKEGEVVSGTVLDIGDDGSLILEVDGKTISVLEGDVTHVRYVST